MSYVHKLQHWQWPVHRITSYNVCYTKLLRKSLLLLLDNFEQVIGAAPLVAELLAACAELKILVTSREGLHISGEREYSVPPLGMPNSAQLQSIESLSQYAAVDLFIQRARAVKLDFNITSVITSYSIHYTKLYEFSRLFRRIYDIIPKRKS